MAKISTYPLLYDDCKSITISFLKQHKYLTPATYKSGTINWSINGNKTGCISIAVSTFSESPYLELDYKLDGKPIKYKVQLVSIPANIGKGIVWHFVCPHTGKRCRKLYLADTYFLHRKAFKGLYKKQTQSKKQRHFEKVFGCAFVSDDVYKTFNSLYFKSHYSGKPTKRYQKLMNKIKAANTTISETDLIKLFR